MERRITVPAKGDYIHGSFIRSPTVDGRFQSRDPGDLDHLVGTFPSASTSVDDAVVEACDSLVEWRDTPLEERAARLEPIPEQLHQVTDRLAELVTAETGKPIWEARMEVLATVRQCDILLKDGPPLLQPSCIDSIAGCSRRMPLGVVAAIAPAPLPVFVPMGYLLSALLAGNTVVFNPSSRTPATGQRIAEVLDRCGLPRGVFNMIQGHGEGVGAALAAHPRVDAVVVAGHVRTARAIVDASHGQVRKRIITQTGGKGTAVVLDGANLERATYEVATGAFLTAGQRFNSTARAVVEDAIYDAFVPRLLDLVGRMRVGYGFDDDVFMGPVIGASLRDEIRERVAGMTAAGAVVLRENDQPVTERQGHYLAPIVLEHGERVANGTSAEEVPGPVLVLERTADREATWAAADRATYGLCAAVFTPHERDFQQAQRRLHVGTLNWNRATVVASGRLPISSWGHAGKGSEGNVYLVRALTQPLSALASPGPFDPSRVMPGITWR